MENTKTRQQIEIKRLRTTVVILAAVLIIATIIIINLQRERRFVGDKSVGSPIDTIISTNFVKKYTKGFFVFDKTTTSFLMDRTLLDSFITHPDKDTPTFYRVFFAKNEEGDRTLVITGAYYDAAKRMIINTHIKGGYDIEHVFPIDDDGTVHRIDVRGDSTWQAYRFPDNTNE